ncbi:hypothetical protein [Streptomyces avicenniae]|uniref:hypothetical protein n=1 Tax=Streptomyces avicenniae TaxID=500153 RepID=UPI0006993320|nr:hypothetical protein [Streptomyces avicenniae]
MTPHAPRSVARGGWRRLVLGVTTSLSLLATACSSGGEATEEPAEEYARASELCDGTISPEAGAALEEIMGTSQFSEPDQSDLARTLREAATAETQYTDFCDLYTPGGESSDTHLQLGMSDTPITNTQDDPLRVFYDAGQLAYAAQASGIISFPCSNASGGYVVVNLYTYGDTMATRDDQILVANSVARAVAGELGCLEEAGLPEGMPRRVGG